MKTYIDSIYSYAHIVEINNSELEKIDLVICKQPKETLGNFYNRQTVKPDVLINAGFFALKTGETIFNVVDEGKTISNDSLYKWGLGILSDHKTLKYGSIANKSNNYVDFVSGYPPLVDNGKSCAPWTWATEINYKALRTIVGYNDNTVFIVNIDKPGLGFTAMANLMIRIGCKYAINLDGGGSSRCLVNGKVNNKPTEDRAVDSVLAFYLKKSNTNSTNNSSNTEYYNYTIKKGDSWWAIASHECGSGASYKNLQQYNNWPTNKALTIGELIKIPYSMSITQKAPSNIKPKITLGTYVLDPNTNKYQIIDSNNKVIKEFTTDISK